MEGDVEATGKDNNRWPTTRERGSARGVPRRAAGCEKRGDGVRRGEDRGWLDPEGVDAVAPPDGGGGPRDVTRPIRLGGCAWKSMPRV